MDVVGVLVALIFGFLIFFLGGKQGLFMLLVLLLFLVASAVVTRIGKSKKKAMKTFEASRGWGNVVANGIVPLELAFLYFLNSIFHFAPGFNLLAIYVCSVAAITADKFSSELGVLDKRVIMLFGLRKTKAGVSGGISVLGTLAGILGAFIIGLTLFPFQNFPLLLTIVVLSGLAGDLFDSLLGYFEIQGMGNKNSSNVGCALAGAIVGYILLI